MSKRFYWMKMKDDYFRKKEIKKLRSIAGGDTFTIIYLKIQLLAVKNQGCLTFDGVEDDFVSELALELDENIDNCRLTVAFMQKHGLLEQGGENGNSYLLPGVCALIGSESESAERVKRFRERQKTPLLTVPLPGNAIVTSRNAYETKCNTDIELDKEKEVERDKEPRKREVFTKPTLDEVKAHILEHGYTFDAEKFIAYYESNGWKVGRSSMKSWQAACVTWSKNNFTSRKDRNGAIAPVSGGRGFGT